MHRLVYTTFKGEIPNGKGFHIHHIDENKQNNHIDNLVLLTAKEHYDISRQNNQTSYREMNEYNWGRRREVYQISLDGKIVARYPHADEAMKQTGVCARNINQVAGRQPYKEGKVRRQAGGYIWRYTDEVDN